MLIRLHQQGRLSAVARDYQDGAHVERHCHEEAQFLYAARGLMRLVTTAGAWVIPPTQAVWIPPGVEHQIFMAGQVQMRTLFITADAAPASLDSCCVLAVPPLLRELVLRAVQLEEMDAEEHKSLVQRLVLHEIAALEHMPLHLPLPEDRRLRAICLALLKAPEQDRTLEDWGLEVGASSRTLARLFARELGMSFNDWRQQLRLTEALPRLLSGQSVQKVAVDLGYGSGRAFSAMFRRLLGKNPKEYVNSLGLLATLEKE
ncbi:helix-turn-helix transcriptional regulator [Pseudomonas sp. JS3066]|jgi:AraC-like DNA-binding protein|uniref:AraC family transcriptional regulator n=1 Tax=unclassified Pseudomonas TaxID=196821 RepID=UPI002E7C26D6|nr:helix-turn-helix transcriptional regulator [Pseudomonas sp. JS3066]WVK92233.1 helix-turn-helix transcriptional regulator [Pseudomonas sp. JS3066]